MKRFQAEPCESAFLLREGRVDVGFASMRPAVDHGIVELLACSSGRWIFDHSERRNSRRYAVEWLAGEF
jgi:hypothetical protein